MNAKTVFSFKNTVLPKDFALSHPLTRLLGYFLPPLVFWIPLRSVFLVPGDTLLHALCLFRGVWVISLVYPAWQ